MMIGGSSLLCGLFTPLALLVPPDTTPGTAELSWAARIAITLLFMAFSATSALGGLFVTRWAFARRVVVVGPPAPNPAAEAEHAIIALAARHGHTLSEADICLHTSMSLAQIRAALDRMRRQGVVEVVVAENDDALAYRVVGLHVAPGPVPSEAPTASPAAKPFEAERPAAGPPRGRTPSQS
jgi:hypothetical protein